MAFSLWDLGSVGGHEMYHMGLIINLNNVQTGSCGFLDPQSRGCENVSLFIFLLLPSCMLWQASQELPTQQMGYAQFPQA